MDISLSTENSSFLEPSLQRRYILTQVGNQQLVFPTQWVTEVMLIERSRILNLPFYDPMLLGVVHHQGSIIPLVTIQGANPIGQDRVIQQPRSQETLTAIRLNSSVSTLPNVGLIVDRVIGSISHEQLSVNEQTATQSSDSPIEVFQPERIPQFIWQTQ